MSFMPTPESRGRARLRRVAWSGPRYVGLKEESFNYGEEIAVPPLLGNPMQGYQGGRLRVHPVVPHAHTTLTGDDTAETQGKEEEEAKEEAKEDQLNGGAPRLPSDEPLLWLDLRHEKAYPGYTVDDCDRWIRLVCAFGTREEVSNSGEVLACDLRGSAAAPGDWAPAERRARDGTVLERGRNVEPLPEDRVFRKLFLDSLGDRESSSYSFAGVHIRAIRTGKGMLAVVVEREPSLIKAAGRRAASSVEG